MSSLKKRAALLSIILVLSIAGLAVLKLMPSPSKQSSTQVGLKLYWFIPDGFRSEPEIFKLYEWARAGKLPNFKRLMERGSFTYSIPVFPGHTPTNFATLLTGFYPETHGINDGPMRIPGYSLQRVVKGGFQSTSRKTTAIWSDLEDHGFKSTLISVPGSTPPEIRRGVVIRGRWGAWGLEFPSLIIQSSVMSKNKEVILARRRLFEMDKELTQVITPSVSPTHTKFSFEIWGNQVNGYINSEQQLTLTLANKKHLATLNENEWSDWQYINLTYALKEVFVEGLPRPPEWEKNLSKVSLESQVRFKAIRLRNKGDFRLRVQFNDLNEFLIYPSSAYAALFEKLGPMVDFVDNYPPQLIYFDEDKQTFLDETLQSLDYHNRLAAYAIDQLKSNSVIHTIYTPNQMLTSRWWMGYLDPQSPRYHEIDEQKRELLWQEVLGMYQGIDRILGTVLDRADEKTVVVFSSDHGAIPLYKEVRLNNLFAKEGLLKVYKDQDGLMKIDWSASKVVFLKMDSIFINPQGLGGVYKRSSGPEYEALRTKVIRLLQDLKDDHGQRPLVDVLTYENAQKWRLDTESAGDLIIANRPHYNWSETITSDLETFHTALSSGYKQAVMPEKVLGMWTPFLIAGPGIKRNHELKAPINHVDQIPTIMKALGIDLKRDFAGEEADVFEAQTN